MATWVTLVDIVYPVGSIYISYSSTSPATIFGGSWTQITSRFLYCTTNVKTGGSNTHTLTVNEMPSHSHDLRFGWGAGNRGSSWARADSNNPNTPWESVLPSGGGQAHNNMPAYQGVYCWRRTA